MKNFISRLIWKFQQLATTKLAELFLWVIISGALLDIGASYFNTHNINNMYFRFFFIIFIYYTCYKIILE